MKWKYVPGGKCMPGRDAAALPLLRRPIPGVSFRPMRIARDGLRVLAPYSK